MRAAAIFADFNPTNSDLCKGILLAFCETRTAEGTAIKTVAIGRFYGAKKLLHLRKYFNSQPSEMGIH